MGASKIVVGQRVKLSSSGRQLVLGGKPKKGMVEKIYSDLPIIRVKIDGSKKSKEFHAMFWEPMELPGE